MVAGWKPGGKARRPARPSHCLGQTASMRSGLEGPLVHVADRVGAVGLACLVASIPIVARAGDECSSFRAALIEARHTVATAPFVETAEEAAEGSRYLATNVTSALQDALDSADPEHPI